MSDTPSPTDGTYAPPPAGASPVEALQHNVSALTVQRDSALRLARRMETINRSLLAHQNEVRDWLADAIATWEGTDDHAATAHAIHQRALELLEQAEAFLR